MPLTRSIDQKSTFSERDNVAYQIKGNHECNNMVANTLLAENNNVKRNLLVVNLRFNEKNVVILTMKCDKEKSRNSMFSQLDEVIENRKI